MEIQLYQFYFVRDRFRPLQFCKHNHVVLKRTPCTQTFAGWVLYFLCRQMPSTIFLRLLSSLCWLQFFNCVFQFCFSCMIITNPFIFVIHHHYFRRNFDPYCYFIWNYFISVIIIIIIYLFIQVGHAGIATVWQLHPFFKGVRLSAFFHWDSDSHDMRLDKEQYLLELLTCSNCSQKSEMRHLTNRVSLRLQRDT